MRLREYAKGPTVVSVIAPVGFAYPRLEYAFTAFHAGLKEAGFIEGQTWNLISRQNWPSIWSTAGWLVRQAQSRLGLHILISRSSDATAKFYREYLPAPSLL
jgi:hypothetical protein